MMLLLLVKMAKLMLEKELEKELVGEARERRCNVEKDEEREVGAVLLGEDFDFVVLEGKAADDQQATVDEEIPDIVGKPVRRDRDTRDVLLVA